ASRLAEDWIIYSTDEFGFLELSEKVTTGSSLMPQKKNPDGLELIRAKTAMMTGLLSGFLNVMKGLPTAYNKDLQEDKEGLFDVVDTLRLCLPAMGRMIETMRVNAAAMRRALDDPAGYVCATELADYLTRRGMPFRDAHHAAGRIVARAADLGVGLADLPLEEMRRIEPSIGPDLPPLLTPEAAVAGRDLFGGTAPRRVKAAIRAIRRESDRLLD
ncbi:MAG: argininosuccinate lyase, partial [Planctomycetes bacterium]|nr:argininosuccinate lyase [Planctomycetota bacterium]